MSGRCLAVFDIRVSNDRTVVVEVVGRVGVSAVRGVRQVFGIMSNGCRAGGSWGEEVDDWAVIEGGEASEFEGGDEAVAVLYAGDGRSRDTDCICGLLLGDAEAAATGTKSAGEATF